MHLCETLTVPGCVYHSAQLLLVSCKSIEHRH